MVPVDATRIALADAAPPAWALLELPVCWLGEAWVMRTAAGEVSCASFGHPLSAITVLAITNKTAAQARMDPAVPKPAM